MAVLTDSAGLAKDRTVEASVLVLQPAVFVPASTTVADAGPYILMPPEAIKTTQDHLVSFSSIKLTDAYNTVFAPANTWG